MPQRKTGFFWIAGVLILAGAVSWSFFFREYFQTDMVNVHLFPKEFSDWKATEIPISDHDYDILETRNAFSRMYRSLEGAGVMLFVVYSQNNRKVSHPPEICYTGSGATIVAHRDVKFSGGEGQGLIDFGRSAIELGGEEETLYYTFKVGNSFTSSYWKQQILIALKTVLGQPASSALIRISIPVKDQDPGDVDTVAQKFVRQMMPFIKEYLP